MTQAQQTTFILALAGHCIELHSELVALKMLLQHRSGFSEADYQRYLEKARQMKAAVLSGKGKSAAQAREEFLRDFQGDVLQ